MDFFLNVGTPVLLLACFVFFRYIQYRDFTVHPAVKILDRYGDPMDVANAIGAEMAKPKYEACKFMITDHWIVSKDDLRVLSLAQIERMTLCDRIEQIRQHHTNAVLGYRKTGKKLALVSGEKWAIGLDGTIVEQEFALHHLSAVTGVEIDDLSTKAGRLP